MSVFGLSKKTLAVLLLSFIALALLPSCSTTEEESMIENPCGCPDGDFDCHETCIREVTP